MEIEEICIFLGSAALTEVLFVNFQIHRWVRNLLGSLMECAEALLFPYGCLLSCLNRESQFSRVDTRSQVCIENKALDDQLIAVEE